MNLFDLFPVVENWEVSGMNLEEAKDKFMWEFEGSHKVWDKWVEGLEDATMKKEAYLKRLQVPHAQLQDTFNNYSCFVSENFAADYEQLMQEANSIFSKTMHFVERRLELKGKWIEFILLEEKENIAAAYHACERLVYLFSYIPYSWELYVHCVLRHHSMNFKLIASILKRSLQLFPAHAYFLGMDCLNKKNSNEIDDIHAYFKAHAGKMTNVFELTQFMLEWSSVGMRLNSWAGTELNECHTFCKHLAKRKHWSTWELDCTKAYLLNSTCNSTDDARKWLRKLLANVPVGCDVALCVQYYLETEREGSLNSAWGHISTYHPVWAIEWEKQEMWSEKRISIREKWIRVHIQQAIDNVNAEQQQQPNLLQQEEKKDMIVAEIPSSQKRSRSPDKKRDTLFISNIPALWTEMEIRSLINNHLETHQIQNAVIEVRIPKRFETIKDRSKFAYVDLIDEYALFQSLLLDQTIPDGGTGPLVVAASDPPPSVIVWNLDFKMSEKDVQDELLHEERKLRIMRDHLGRSRGIVFIDVKNQEEGEALVDRIQGIELRGRNLRAQMARNEDKPKKPAKKLKMERQTLSTKPTTSLVPRQARRTKVGVDKNTATKETCNSEPLDNDAFRKMLE